MTDSQGRIINYLRLSVTELCNLRCIYCMPPEGVCKREHGDICSLEELAEMAEAFTALGIRKIRLTGGEPLVRRGVLSLVEQLAVLKSAGLQELCMTTNGQLLKDCAAALRAAGLDRLNISLDTLRPERYRMLTRGGELDRVLEGIAAAEAAGFERISLNAVLLKDVNEDELRELALLAREHPWSVRFIERMPIGPGAGLAFLPASRVLACVPELEPVDSGGVARLFHAPGWAGNVGLITPISGCFCARCDRVRLTADGKLKLCLHAAEEIPLRGLHGDELQAAILAAVQHKPARHRLIETQSSGSARPMNEIGG